MRPSYLRKLKLNKSIIYIVIVLIFSKNEALRDISAKAYFQSYFSYTYLNWFFFFSSNLNNLCAPKWKICDHESYDKKAFFSYELFKNIQNLGKKKFTFIAKRQFISFDFVVIVAKILPCFPC